MRSHPWAAVLLVTATAAGALSATAPPAAGQPSAPRVRPAVRAGAWATCHLAERGSAAVATCHNPDPDVTRVQLHVFCERWWDPATDAEPVTVGPAQWVTLTGRCWKEIRAMWVTQQPVPAGP